MTFPDITSYFLTVFAIAIAPGPVVLMLLVRAASNDIRGAIGFGLGYAFGGVLIITTVCFGLSAWLTATPEVFEYSKYVMMAYILWLAYGIWKGGFDMSKAEDSDKRGSAASVIAGIMTCCISPYMMILFPLVLPGLMDVTSIQMPDFLITALATFAALAVGAGLVIGFAAQLRRLVQSPQHVARMNQGLSSLLVVGGGCMAFI